MALSDSGVRSWQTVQHYLELRIAETGCVPRDLMEGSVAFRHRDIPKESLVPALRSLTLQTTKLQSLDLGINHLSNEGCRELCALITASSSLRNLTLQSCKLQQRECRAILHALNVNISACVQVLDLSFNNLGDQGARVVADILLSKNERLRSLKLSRNRITDVGAQVIFDTLASSNSSLLHLDLSHNPTKIGDSGNLLRGLRLETLKLRDNGIVEGAELFEALKSATLLKALDISENRLGKVGAKAVGKLLEVSSSLQCLNLWHTGIDNGLAIPICHALSINTSLQSLDLSANQLTQPDFEAMALGLTHNTTLRTLQLVYTCTQGADMYPLAAALAHNSSLEILEISRNKLRDQGAKVVAQVLLNSKSLQYLDISGNRVLNDGIRALCDALACNTARLLVLILGSMADEDCQHSVAHMLRHNSTLQCLSVAVASPASGGPSTCECVLKALAYNSSLRRLTVEGEECGQDCVMELALALRTNMTLRHLQCNFSQNISDNVFAAVGQVLLECPRVCSLFITGVPLARVARSLGLPGNDHGDTREGKWTDGHVAWYLQNTHFDKVTAFAMGQHERLGQASIVQHLKPDSVSVVILCYFGLPLDYLDKPRAGCEYVDLLAWQSKFW